MNKFRFTLIAMAIMAMTLMVSSTAQAQATRTWVSGVGDDVNPCSRTAPCKTYAGAISKTAKDGEISTLDPGGFGAVTITKSITINGGGGGQGFGSILAASVNAIVINITAATDVRKTVRLNWLDINGASSGLDGVRWLAGSELHIENTNIDGFTGDGIDVAFGAVATSFFSMRNTVIRNCGGAGIKMAAFSTGTTNFAFDTLDITRCATGIDAQNGSKGNVHNSKIALNTTGIALSEGASGTGVNVDGSTISSNSGTALTVSGGSRGRIARCTISQNGTSLAPAASWDTGGNNTIMGNTTNTAPAGTVFPQN